MTAREIVDKLKDTDREPLEVDELHVVMCLVVGEVGRRLAKDNGDRTTLIEVEEAAKQYVDDALMTANHYFQSRKKP